MSNKKDYKVGYKRPPVDTRFKPGQSGNPSGRPNRKGLKQVVEAYLNTEITVTLGNRKVTMTRLEALVYRMFEPALSGNLKGFPPALQLLQGYGTDVIADALQDPQLQVEERELVRQVLEAYKAKSDGAAPK